jgi:peptidoglycan/LPS O-acetylase OafA/YrhL
MTDSSIQPKKLQWKWVGITYAMYLLLYLLPMYLVGNFITDKISVQLVGGWMFGGIIIIAALAGYLSKGVTIWEPAIAGAGLVLAFFIVVTVYVKVFINPSYSYSGEFFGILIPMIIVFLLSLLGAWLGERAQKLWKTKSPESI